MIPCHSLSYTALTCSTLCGAQKILIEIKIRNFVKMISNMLNVDMLILCVCSSMGVCSRVSSGFLLVAFLVFVIRHGLVGSEKFRRTLASQQP